MFGIVHRNRRIVKTVDKMEKMEKIGKNGMQRVSNLYNQSIEEFARVMTGHENLTNIFVLILFICVVHLCSAIYYITFKIIIKFLLKIKKYVYCHNILNTKQ